mmetsp:Transcript_89714/g.262284  ORF Transcript_89714/g.262284 Transcript_89714/m.262284 type:complete len:299 (-) Transcript_89714:43-939(-)
MDEWLRTLSEWAAWGETLVFGGPAGRCGGVRPNFSCPMIRETCMPRYQSTTVEALELQRSKLALALVGQLTVVTFRLLTGHVTGTAAGLFLFVVGNNARCSLRTSLVTSYVVLGSVSGVLDVFDLLREILSFGSGFLALPFDVHLSQNLSAISLVLAPVAEIGGAHCAWDCYLRPSMLFRDVSARENSAADASPWLYHGLAAAVGQALYDPRAELPSPALLAPPASPPRTRQPHDDAWPTPSAPPDPRCCRSPEQEACSECGAALPPGGRWQGSGRYWGEVYCTSCWSYWGSEPARIG